MDHGLWVWPSEQRGQRRTLMKVASSEHLMATMNALVKSPKGLSNSEIDDAIADNSNWMTLWVVRQLVSLGFVEYKVDFFGGPAKYELTTLGRDALSWISGEPLTQPPAAPQKSQVAA